MSLGRLEVVVGGWLARAFRDYDGVNLPAAEAEAERIARDSREGDTVSIFHVIPGPVRTLVRKFYWDGARVVKLDAESSSG